jgi:hypothetical protein
MSLESSGCSFIATRAVRFGGDILSGMQFVFEGNKYRIVFSYDKDRTWAAHRWHPVKFVNAYRGKRGPKGPPQLWCEGCNLQLSHLPKAQRKRLVHCTLLAHASPVDRAAWESIASGTGRVNLKAGDQFSRKEGREAALTGMLQNMPSNLFGGPGQQSARHFRAAAWDAYNHRKEAGPFRKEQGDQGESGSV